MLVGNDTILFVYKPDACHSYNVTKLAGYNVKIATIDTMLSFYLAFLYAPREYFQNYTDRIVCMAQFLFDVQEHNRLNQVGVLQRFSATCYGHQETREEGKAEKSAKFMELKAERNGKEFEERFLQYRPGQKVQKQTRKSFSQKKIPHKKLKTKKYRKDRGRGGLFYL